MTTKEHPHAEVLRAIADGVPLSEFEVTWGSKALWANLEENFYVLLNDQTAEIRRIPQYIMVNGFKVPKPLDVFDDDEYFTPNCEEIDFYCSYRHHGDIEDGLWLSRGIVHSTKESAIAHAKAMLGIDPEYFK